MNSFTQVMTGHAAFAHPLDKLRPWFLLATRLWVSWQFWKSGWLKLTTWDITLELFRSEYQVPLLPPGSRRSAAHSANCFSPRCSYWASSRGSARSDCSPSTRWP